MQRWIAAVENCAFEGIVIQYLARIHCEGYECDVLEDRLTATVTASRQVGSILHVTKGFVGKLNEEDGKGNVRRHMLHIYYYRVVEGIVAVPAHNCHQACRLWEGFLDAAGYQWKLNDSGWWQRIQHMHRWSQATSTHLLAQKLNIGICRTALS